MFISGICDDKCSQHHDIGCVPACGAQTLGLIVPEIGVYTFAYKYRGAVIQKDVTMTIAEVGLPFSVSDIFPEGQTVFFHIVFEGKYYAYNSLRDTFGVKDIPNQLVDMKCCTDCITNFKISTVFNFEIVDTPVVVLTDPCT